MPAVQRMGLQDGRHPDHLVIVTQLPFGDEVLDIEVAYPFEFPEEGPTIYGKTVLDRHQNPAGNFCWAEDHDRDWWPGMSAAEIVDRRIRTLLADSALGPGAVEEAEADMPEPVTGHLTFSPGVVVVMDPYFRPDLPGNAGSGEIELVGRSGRFLLMRAIGLGKTRATATEVCELYFQNQRAIKGHWISITGAVGPEVFTPKAILERVRSALPQVPAGLAQMIKKNHLAQADCWVGLTFMEEGPSRGELRRNWVFAQIRLNNKNQGSSPSLLRAQALTKDERARRIPELTGLDGASVVVAGAGSLGAPLVLELAKAGVGQIDVIDNDFVDVNNSVRHPLSPGYAGGYKALSVGRAAQEANPFIRVLPHTLSVGAGPVEAQQVADLVNAADVVVDTTGSSAVARILQRECSEAHTPMVVAGLTAGSFGGEVLVCEPGGPCFDCFAQAQGAGTIPEPPAAPAGPGVTPIGCSHPAFSGAGFDATALAARAARTVVQATGRSAYPPAGFNWAVVNFRHDPEVQTGTLARHPGCWRHS